MSPPGRSRRPLLFPGGPRILQRMYTRLGLPGRPPHFVAEYYPYASLVQTIRLREETVHARFSDLLRSEPLPVLEAAAAILLARLYRRRAPKQFLEAYREFSLHGLTRRRMLRLRRKRARPVERGPRGAVHHLGPLFDRLNRRYFAGALPRPALAWSARPWRTQLGCFDPALRQIVLSSRLDRKGVPAYVVEYVLFHEMLHLRHPLRRARCGLEAHPAKFRREERRLESYARARRFLARRFA